MKKFFIFLIAFSLIISAVVFAGGKQEESAAMEKESADTTEASSASSAEIQLEEKSEEDLPVPNERYLIAFSNGDMNNSWRWAFVDSMEQWAYRFKNIGPGIDYVWTNSHADSARQLMDCETLLSMNPDILIVSPNQDEPLDPVIDMATDAGVPLIVIDRSLVRKPPIGTYITNITQNYCNDGVYEVYYALEYLKSKYGEYKGNIVEIQGLIGASANTDIYVGVRAILKNYPDVKIIGTGEGGFSQDGGRKVMEGFLQRFGPGEIDVILTYADQSGLGAIDAIKAAHREDELLGGIITGRSPTVGFLKEVLNGNALMSTECPPFYGAFTIPLAIEYLNGDVKPDPITFLGPLRCWENPNDDFDLTPEEDDAAVIKKHIKYAEDRGLDLVPPESGNYDTLVVEIENLPGYDEVLEYTKTREIPEGITDLQNFE